MVSFINRFFLYFLARFKFIEAYIILKAQLFQICNLEAIVQDLQSWQLRQACPYAPEMDCYNLFSPHPSRQAGPPSPSREGWVPMVYGGAVFIGVYFMLIVNDMHCRLLKGANLPFQGKMSSLLDRWGIKCKGPINQLFQICNLEAIVQDLQSWQLRQACPYAPEMDCLQPVFTPSVPASRSTFPFKGRTGARGLWRCRLFESLSYIHCQ